MFAELFGWTQHQINETDEEVILDHLTNLRAKAGQRKHDQEIEAMKARLKDKSKRK